MTRDVIVSRRCMVGPDGYFGFESIDGAVSVHVDFFRPEPDLDEGPAYHPLHWCEYQIVYGGEVIHTWKMMGMDSVEALLSSMRDAAHHFDGPYFNKIEGDVKYRDVIPYIGAIPREWWHDMQIAGTEPMWIAEEQVMYQHEDGTRTSGRIALGYPHPGAGPYRASCIAWLEGLDKGYWTQHEADTAFQALQLAMASLATRLRAFVADGGSVLKPNGDGEVDLKAIFGPLMRDGAEVARKLDAEIAST